MLAPMDRLRSTLPEAGWTVVEVALVTTLMGLFLGMAVPNVVDARLRNNEAAAARALREVLAAQVLVRDSGLLDTDGDGRGEFAFLQELSGERVPRAGKSLLAEGAAGVRRGAPPGPLPQFYLRLEEDGEARITGYAYRVYLPGAGGAAVAESHRGTSLSTTGTVDAGLGSDTWCAYAWPVDRAGEWWWPASGRAAFFVNQAGVVLRAPAARYGSLPRSGFAPSRPEPGAAFAGPGPADCITGPAAVDAEARDGLVWRRLR